MKDTNQRLTKWAISKIEREYKDDVCLLVGYDLDGLEQNVAGGPFMYFKGGFDYYIPATDRAYSLAQTFILDGIGYDLYPRSWERIEGMADLEDYNTCCLADATVLYARTDEDRARFEGYRQKLFDHLKDRTFMYKKALEKLDVAMGIYQTMMFSEKPGEVRMAAGFIADFLSVGVAFMNGTYFKHSQVNQLVELASVKEIPDGFFHNYEAILRATAMDELKNLSHLMIFSTRKFFEMHKPPKTTASDPDFKNLAGWYQELSYTWRRIYHSCYLGNIFRAFIWGCALQHELEVICEEFGLEDIDLMGSYDAADLKALENRAKELERYIVGTITDNGESVDAYDTVEEFLEKNG